MNTIELKTKAVPEEKTIIFTILLKSTVGLNLYKDGPDSVQMSFSDVYTSTSTFRLICNYSRAIIPYRDPRGIIYPIEFKLMANAVRDKKEYTIINHPGTFVGGNYVSIKLKSGVVLFKTSDEDYGKVTLRVPLVNLQNLADIFDQMYRTTMEIFDRKESQLNQAIKFPFIKKADEHVRIYIDRRKHLTFDLDDIMVLRNAIADFINPNGYQSKYTFSAKGKNVLMEWPGGFYKWFNSKDIPRYLAGIDMYLSGNF